MHQPEQPGSPTRPDLIAVRPRRFTVPWVGACLWLFCFQFFIAEQIARLGWSGHYSMTRDYISDLGAVRCSVSGSVCSSLHWVMNGSFMLQGLSLIHIYPPWGSSCLCCWTCVTQPLP